MEIYILILIRNKDSKYWVIKAFKDKSEAYTACSELDEFTCEGYSHEVKSVFLS